MMRRFCCLQNKISSCYKHQTIGYCWENRLRQYANEYNDTQLNELFANDSPETKTVEKLIHGIKDKDRAALSRAITLIESTNIKKNLMGQIILQAFIGKATENVGNLSLRIGLSGPPGSGKSTFIEAFGTYLTNVMNLKVAVLAIDPSSQLTGGSLLGDKTRMTELSRNSKAYIRPSPSQCTLGGVARNTSEAMILCEGFGYDVVIVETVGVGQSEITVADMTDIFLLLIPPASGDELQGIKRGIIEMADIVVVNKADGDLLPAARRITAEYTSALKLMPKKHDIWRPRVRKVSSLQGDGIPELWTLISSFRLLLQENDLLINNRKAQLNIWMWNHIKENIIECFKTNDNIKNNLSGIENLVTNFKITPGLASDILLSNFTSAK